MVTSLILLLPFFSSLAGNKSLLVGQAWVAQNCWVDGEGIGGFLLELMEKQVEDLRGGTIFVKLCGDDSSSSSSSLSSHVDGLTSNY